MKYLFIKNIEVNIKFSPSAWTYNYKSNRFAKGMHYLQIILTFNHQNKEKGHKSNYTQIIDFFNDLYNIYLKKYLFI